MNTTNELFNLNEKGIIFSTDAIISFIIMLFTTLIFIAYLSNTITSEQRNIEQIEHDEKAMFIADSMVKNQNSENALLGACNYDSSKKRVLTNNLNFSKIKTNSKPIELGKLFVKNVLIIFTSTNQKENILISQKTSNNCITVKRFALVDEKKALIEVTTCKTK